MYGQAQVGGEAKVVSLIDIPAGDVFADTYSRAAENSAAGWLLA
jgi:hypothetical protein